MNWCRTPNLIAERSPFESWRSCRADNAHHHSGHHLDEGRGGSRSVVSPQLSSRRTDAIVSKDLNGIVISWNPGAEKMFGYSAKEMIGRPITTIIPPELQDDERRILETIGRGERIEHFETVRLTKSGEQIDVSLTVSPVRDDAGRVIGAAKIARDITQRKEDRAGLAND